MTTPKCKLNTPIQDVNSNAYVPSFQLTKATKLPDSLKP